MGPPDRLLRAVERGLLPELAQLGFSLGARSSAGRGSLVELVSQECRLGIQSDWLEGELVVEVQEPGRSPKTLLHLTRLARDINASALESRLRLAAPSIAAEILGRGHTR
jgi:hypothetical protein